MCNYIGVLTCNGRMLWALVGLEDQGVTLCQGCTYGRGPTWCSSVEQAMICSPFSRAWLYDETARDVWRVTLFLSLLSSPLLFYPLPTKRRLRRSSAGPPLHYIPFSANVDTYLFEHYSLQIKATFICTIDIVLLSFRYHLTTLRVCICKYEIKDNFIFIYELWTR